MKSLPISAAFPNNSLSDLSEHILRLDFFGDDIFDDALDNADLEVFEDPSLHHLTLLTSHCEIKSSSR